MEMTGRLSRYSKPFIGISFKTITVIVFDVFEFNGERVWKAGENTKASNSTLGRTLNTVFDNDYVC